ncbi:uncharacterized protein EV422DRAFT_502714 [Fimicolochytrium jonesii]|uniref:uncharacterized protein n=1 Tax=Fimicolochytrium jonesii TaxID=1396493 RepID=UPI0022FE4150|nr:uncharacterized protein EV422DRAFT_502714 [Fimicolochytrium jonesii]KAI8826997.1 hypothetical protein EV422DRAFT_502714 [Fimicolochytrium jonesii]
MSTLIHDSRIPALWPHSPKSHMARPKRRLDEDDGNQAKRLRRDEGSLQDHVNPIVQGPSAFAGSFHTADAKIPVQSINLPFPSPRPKRQRDQDDDDDTDSLPSIDLQPLTKRIRPMEQSVPDLTTTIQRSQPVALDTDSLALVPYIRQSPPAESMPIPTTKEHAFSIDEMLAQNLHAPSWGDFPRYSFSEGDGQLVLYTGGRWKPRETGEDEASMEDQQWGGAGREGQFSGEGAGVSSDMMEIDC